MRIYVVEDNQDLRSYIKDIFIEKGFHVYATSSGENLADDLAQFKPECILLDDLLPDCRGLDLVQDIKSMSLSENVPVIMLTGNMNNEDILKAFELGVDDYVVKPFDARILIQKVRNILRRYYPQQPRSQAFYRNDLLLDLEGHRVLLKDQELPLTLTEFKILKELFRENGKIVTRDDLLNRVAGAVNVTARTVDVHVCSLRKKLKGHGDAIRTVRGVGYRLAEHS